MGRHQNRLTTKPTKITKPCISPRLPFARFVPFVVKQSTADHKTPVSGFRPPV